MKIDQPYLERLLDLSQQFARDRTQAQLLEAVLEAALDISNADAGYLILRDELGKPDYRLHRYLPGVEIARPDSQLRQAIFKNVFQAGQDLIISSSAADPWDPEPGKTLPPHSVICVPLLVPPQRVVGAILLENCSTSNTFTEADLPPLRLFSGQAVTAIENASLNDALEARLAALTAELQQGAEERKKLHEDLEKVAVLDPLTGVNNRHNFYSQAESELERALRYRRHLALLLLDIDHFKSVNDTYGHTTGDEVLAEVAHRIQGTLRSNDILGRVGGEEFAIVMPETDGDQAEAAAERLRELIAARMVDTGKGPVPVTISLGVTSLHERVAVALDTLMEETNQALYTAKLGGRNKAAARRLQQIFSEPAPPPKPRPPKSESSE